MTPTTHRSVPAVLHVGRSTIQSGLIPHDPSQIAAFIRDQFRAAGRTSPAEARDQMIARIRGTLSQNGGAA